MQCIVTKAVALRSKLKSSSVAPCSLSCSVPGFSSDGCSGDKRDFLLEQG